MPQIVKIVDLTQSYLPGDPNAFPDNLHFTVREDQPDKPLPILMYEGYNFLPTAYGYRSYFGADTTLLLAALPTPCDEIFVFQSKTYENMLVALCSDGIRTAEAGVTSWTVAKALPDDWTDDGIYRQYTWCIIENNLYIYRQGYAKVIKIDDSFVVTEFTPSFLNMAGQMGIFRGNGRLCFWDSENSVAWSSAFDLTDFTPSIENMVGNATFLGIVGRIVMILPHGEGYVIYSTRSIVGVTYTTVGTQVWNASTITAAGGITHPKAVTLGKGTEEHFAYTTIGVVTIGHFNALSKNYSMEIILTELFDFLKESREPVYLQCHASRFLFFSLVNNDYITGITSFTDVDVPTLKAPVLVIDKAYIDSIADTGVPPTASETFQMIDSFLRNPTGDLRVDYTADVYDVPRWTLTGHVPSVISPANVPEFFPNDPSAGSITAHAVAATDFFRDGTSDEALDALDDAAATVFDNWTDITAVESDAVQAYYRNWVVSDPYYSCAYLNLYPGDDITPHANNGSGKSCWDFIFNAGCISDSAYNALQAQVDNYPNKPALAVEVIFETYEPAPTIADLEGVVNTQQPRASQKHSNIVVELDRSGAIPQLNFINYSAIETQLSLESISRTVTDYEFIPDEGGTTNPDAPILPNKYRVELQCLGYSWSKNYSTEPTVEQVADDVLAVPFWAGSDQLALKISDVFYISGVSISQDTWNRACFHLIGNVNIEIFGTITCNKYDGSSVLYNRYRINNDDSYTLEALNDANNPDSDTKNSPYYNLIVTYQNGVNNVYSFGSLSIMQYCLEMQRILMGDYSTTVAYHFNTVSDNVKLSSAISYISTPGDVFEIELRANVVWQNGGGASNAIINGITFNY